MEHPEIIQGGMGVAVSNWRLANAVSRLGQLGVVSGTALDSVLVRRLADGDPGGHCRRALASFPLPRIAQDVLDRYFKPEGREEGEGYPATPMHTRVLTPIQEELLVLANYVEVFLAREGHDGPVGINFLTKIQFPNLPSLYGAMLAGAAYVLMGAGIPKEVPGAMDALANHEPAQMRLDVQGGRGDADEVVFFDPARLWSGAAPPQIMRPNFLPIVASNSLATMMARKANGRVDGFIIEGPTAGGHNAPPRGRKQLNERGEPIYGERDVVDLSKIAELGLPFWIAGGAGSPEGLEAAKRAGGAGIQVGTLFAYCSESGLRDDLRGEVLDRCRAGEIDVLTDDRASPTSFPFKTVALPGSLSEEDAYLERERVCDLGYLRVAYRRDDGRIGYRCASEPAATFVKKGGAPADVPGRKCLCNSLMANVGYPQVRDGNRLELPLLTSGDDLTRLGGFLGQRSRYSASDVIAYLLNGKA